MINSRKKGFTLVELVIVIAVVAILAAVLIPTFTNLIKKANMSSDQVAVRNMNTILATEEIDKEINSIEIVRDVLLNNGYDVKSHTPIAKGTRFYWISTIKRIVYVNEQTKHIIYPLNLGDGLVFDDNTWFSLDIDVDNLNADQHAVKQMNDVLSLEEINKVFGSIADVKTALKNAGYESNKYVPLDTNSAFYWIPEINRIILADTDKNVLYPTNLDIIPSFGVDENGKDTWVPMLQENLLILNDAPPVSVTDYIILQHENYDEDKEECWITTDINYVDVDLAKCQKLVKFNTMENGVNDYTYQIANYGKYLADYVIILDDDFYVDTPGGIIGGFENHDGSVFWSALVLDEAEGYPGYDAENRCFRAGTEFYLLDMLLENEGAGIEYQSIIEVWFGPITDKHWFNSFVCGAFNYCEENVSSSITVQLRIYENNDGTKGDKYAILNEITCEFTSDNIMAKNKPIN